MAILRNVMAPECTGADDGSLQRAGL